MRRCWVFIFIFILFSIPKLSAQELTSTKITLQAKKIKLEDVLEYLSLRYKIKFSYATDILSTGLVDFDVRNESSQEAMQNIFTSYNLDFSIVDDNHILLRKENGDAIEQNKMISISGHIISSNGSGPLDFVMVSLVSANLATYSDQYGRFELQLPEEYKDQSIQLHLIGYAQENISVLDLMKRKDVTISLMPQPYRIEQVIVVADRSNRIFALPSPHTNISAVSIKTADVTMIESDVLRAVQFLPGVSAHNESSGEIEIRNSQNDETRILLDNIPIYNAGHYYGIFSSIHSDYVRSIDVYKNIYPIWHGGKTGGIIDMRGILDQPDKLNGSIEFNLLQASALINIPIDKKNVLSLAGRSTLGNISNSNYNNMSSNNGDGSDFVQNFMSSSVNRVNLINNTPEFKFYDIQGKWKSFLSENHTLDFNFFRSDDQFVNDYALSFMQRVGDERFLIKESYNHLEEWSNQGYSVNWNWSLSPDVKLVTSGHYAKYDNVYALTTSLDQTAMQAGNRVDYFSDQSNEIRDMGVDIHGIKSYKNKNELTIGASVINYDAFFNVDRDRSRILGKENEATEYNAYAQYVWNINSRFSTTLGVRGNYFSLLSTPRFSPRLLFHYKLNENLHVKSSFSRYYQNVREIYYENATGQSLDYWVLSDDVDIPPIRSDNMMLGMLWSKSSFKFDIELFRKSGAGMIEYAQSQSGFDMSMSGPPPRQNVTLYNGTSLSYGVDMGFGLDLTKYSAQLSYTWSKSTYSFRQIARGEAFPSQNDRRHQLKLQQIIDLSPFELSFNTVYASGKPYTDNSRINMNADQVGNRPQRVNLRPKDRISRLPDYLRFDLGLYYKVKLNARSLQLGLSLLNVLDRNNVKYIQNIYSLSGEGSDPPMPSNVVIGTETSLLARTLNVSAKVNF